MWLTKGCCYFFFCYWELRGNIKKKKIEILYIRALYINDTLFKFTIRSSKIRDQD